MTIGTFEHLGEDDKIKTLLANGRVISETKDRKCRSFLYYLGAFYAAVKYKVGTDELVSITAFERIGREERIKWKVLRVLSDERIKIRKDDDNLI
jgi:hypothetical protein